MWRGSTRATGQMAPWVRVAALHICGGQGPQRKRAKGRVRKSLGMAVATWGSAGQCPSPAWPGEASHRALSAGEQGTSPRSQRWTCAGEEGSAREEVHRSAQLSASGSATCCASEADSGGRSVTLSGTCRMRGGCEGASLGRRPSREGEGGEPGQQAHRGAGAGRGCKPRLRVRGAH